MYQENKLFSTAKASNWKQKNAVLAMCKDKPRFYDESLDKFKKETDIIVSYLKEIISEEPFSPDYYYLKELLPLGDILGYKNVHLQSICWHRGECEITFHLKFEVENPFIDHINELKKHEASFFNLSENEFKAKEKEWKKLYDEIKKYDPYIPNFTYAYTYEIPTEKYSEIIELLKNPDYKQYAIKGIEIAGKVSEMRYEIEKLTYQERLIYWDLNDEYDDIRENRIPSNEMLAQRKARREKSEEQYNAEYEKQRELLKDIIPSIIENIKHKK